MGYVTVAELAEILLVSRKQIYKAVEDNPWIAIRLGPRLLRISLEDYAVAVVKPVPATQEDLVERLKRLYDALFARYPERKDDFNGINIDGHIASYAKTYTDQRGQNLPLPRSKVAARLSK